MFRSLLCKYTNYLSQIPTFSVTCTSFIGSKSNTTGRIPVVNCDCYTMVDTVELNSISNVNVHNFIKEFIKGEELQNCEISSTNAVEKGNNFLGIVIRVKLSGRKPNGDEFKKAFICKTASTNETTRKVLPLIKFFTIEVHAYNSVFPAFERLQQSYIKKDDYKFVKCYKATVDDLNEVIIMEDLSVRGYKLWNRKVVLDHKHYQLALKNMAYYHALSFALKEHKPEEYRQLAEFVEANPWYENTESNKGFVQLSKTRAEQHLSNEFSLKKLKEYQRTFSDIFYEGTNGKTIIPYDVLCHGDCWVSNMLFKYEDAEPLDVVFLDYQLMKRCSPVVDIMHLMFTSSDEAYRRDHYDELINYYYECLGSRLKELNCEVSKSYPRDIFEAHLKTLLPFGMVIAFMFLPIQLSEPADIMDLEQAAKNIDDDNPQDITFKDPKTKAAYCDRIDGLIRDFVKFNVL